MQKLTDGDLEDNKETMTAAYGVNLSIETLYKRIEACVQYAAAGNIPFTPAQVVSTAFCVIKKNRYVYRWIQGVEENVQEFEDMGPVQDWLYSPIH